MISRRSLAALCATSMLVWGSLACTDNDKAPSSPPDAQSATSHDHDPLPIPTLQSDKKTDYDFFSHFSAARFQKVSGLPGTVKPYQLPVDGKVRTGIFAHAPAKFAYTVTVKPGSVLEFTPFVHPKQADISDGEKFIITVTPKGGQPAVIYQKELQPKTTPADREPKLETVALDKFAGQTVEIEFATDNAPGKSIDGDWGLWFEPRLAFSK